jgi:hypothetical protein
MSLPGHMQTIIFCIGAVTMMKYNIIPLFFATVIMAAATLARLCRVQDLA